MLNAISTAAYTGIVHTHKLSVILFLIFYVVKLGLLLFNEKKLDKMRSNKFARIFEAVISVLFLVTGVILLFNVAQIQTFLWIKLVAVFASIPIAIIGFKKKNKVLAILSVVLIFAAYGLAEMSKKQFLKPQNANMVYTEAQQTVYGQELYLQYCKNCHGEDGAAQRSGAKNLQLTTLSDAEIKAQIQNGKSLMPAYKTILDEKQIDALVAHVKSFKK